MVNNIEWSTVRIRSFFRNKIKNYVGSDKEIPNISQFVNLAIKEKIDRMKEEEVQK